MKAVEQMRVELSASDVEKIVSDHVAEIMSLAGYELDYSRNEDGPYPDVFFRGSKKDLSPEKEKSKQ